MPGAPRKSPAELAPGWPDRPSDDITAEVARRIAVTIRDRTAGGGVRALARLADVHPSTLLNVLAGSIWPSAQLIAKLEAALDEDVWPGRLGADGD